MEPSDRLVAELVTLGRHLHWPLSEMLDLDHATRRLFLARIEADDD